MTAAEATHGQPATAQKTMSFDGFVRVAGATGVETTVAGHQRANGIAVELDRNERQFTHLDCLPLQTWQ